MTAGRIQAAARTILLHAEGLVGECSFALERLEAFAAVQSSIAKGSQADVYLANAASALREQAAAIEGVRTRLLRSQP